VATSRIERGLIRALIGTALAAALLSWVAVPIPRHLRGDPALPAVALDQVGLYRLEVTLLVFYGGLLMITPAYAGLVRGRLPIEISTRGAKFTEETSEAAERTEAAVQELKQTTLALAESLTAAHLEIERLREAEVSDSTQPGVDSKR
jgi:hypothetical protein